MTPFLQDADMTLWHGDVLDVLRQLPSESVHMACTSPPFYGLRDYGTGSWEGGDEGCDHDPQARHIYGCKGCGAHMNENTPGCRWCEDRHLKRQIHGTSERNIQERDPTRPDLPDPPASWAIRDATSRTFKTVCAKCGARRVDQQIGLEATPDLWVSRLVEVFREVRRVLRKDGTLWVEIGDSYYHASGGYNPTAPSNQEGHYDADERGNAGSRYEGRHERGLSGRTYQPLYGYKPKDLIGAPWLLAFALRADGWYLRSEVIWSKPNPMPESVSDRCTTSHSRVFMFAKSPRYYWDAEAIREASITNDPRRPYGSDGAWQMDGRDKWEQGAGQPRLTEACVRNRRSVWEFPTQPYPEAHFATWPEKLVEPMILAGTSERGVCPECGAPWQRITTEVHDAEGRTTNGQKERTVERRGFDVRMVKSTETTGWQPTCGCGMTQVRGYIHPDPVPATVLDPFVGSGTTCFVARRLGRRSIGIDLNREYLELAARRTQQQSLEFS